MGVAVCRPVADRMPALPTGARLTGNIARGGISWAPFGPVNAQTSATRYKFDSSFVATAFANPVETIRDSGRSKSRVLNPMAIP